MTDKIKPPAPSFVFVDNATERLLGLRRTVESPPGVMPTQEHTAVGRGLNYVRADYVEANLDVMGSIGMTLVDPCKIPDGLVQTTLDRCTSRQAMHEWVKIEKRPRAIDQIKHRLANKPEPRNDESN